MSSIVVKGHGWIQTVRRHSVPFDAPTEVEVLVLVVLPAGTAPPDIHNRLTYDVTLSRKETLPEKVARLEAENAALRAQIGAP